LAGIEDSGAVNARSVQPFFTARLAEALKTAIKSTSPEVGRIDIEAVVRSSGRP
jgi:hypothetical protein